MHAGYTPDACMVSRLPALAHPNSWSKMFEEPASDSVEEAHMMSAYPPHAPVDRLVTHASLVGVAASLGVSRRLTYGMAMATMRRANSVHMPSFAHNSPEKRHGCDAALSATAIFSASLSVRLSKVAINCVASLTFAVQVSLSLGSVLW